MTTVSKKGENTHYSLSLLHTIMIFRHCRLFMWIKHVCNYGRKFTRWVICLEKAGPDFWPFFERWKEIILISTEKNLNLVRPNHWLSRTHWHMTPVFEWYDKYQTAPKIQSSCTTKFQSLREANSRRKHHLNNSRLFL